MLPILTDAHRLNKSFKQQISPGCVVIRFILPPQIVNNLDIIRVSDK